MKARTKLAGDSLALRSYSQLKAEVVESDPKTINQQIAACTRSITDLSRKVKEQDRLVREKNRLERRISELDRIIPTRFHDDSYKREKEQAVLELKGLRVGTEAAASQTKSLLGQKELLLERLRGSLSQAKLRLPLLVKVQKLAEDLGLAESQGSVISEIDRRLADLDKDLQSPWLVQAATAYAKERAVVARKAQKEEADNRKQLEKDSKELAGLQGSEAAISKRIEALKRRLKRENERVLAERKFIYTNLNNKARSQNLTQRERVILPYFDAQTWARDPRHARWATKGVEFSAKLRTSARKIEELEADIAELNSTPKRIRALKSSIRKLEKDIATADKANAAAGGWPKGKAPRIGYIANAHAFEKYMAEWMRWLGWDDAKAMPVGPDEGIDVKATGALGQAKHWDTEVGIEEVQRHNGVCEGIQKYGRVFLSKSGYTPQAIKWANDRDLPLFEMKAGSKDAGVVASSKAGEKLLKVGAKAMKGNKRN